MLIDAHAHVIPRWFPSAPAGCDPASWPSMSPGDDGTRVLVSGPVRFTARQAWFDAEQRLAASAGSGVDAEVVSPFPPLLNYQLPALAGRDLARWVNEYVAGLCAAAPGRIYGLGTVPLQDPELAAGELGSLSELGLAGVEIASNVAGASLGDERFLGFFAEASRLAFSHAAGGFPLQLPRAQWFWGRTWNEEPVVAAARGPEAAPWAASETGPAELARRFWYDSLVFDRRAIRYLIEMLGAGRLLVGSDFPAMPREEPCGRTLRSMGVPDTDLDDITWYNCFRFLGIAPPKLFSIGEHDVG